MYFTINLLCKLRVIYAIYTIVNLLKLTEFENVNVKHLVIFWKTLSLNYPNERTLTL